MKAFLYKVLTFTLPIMVLGYGIDVYLSAYLRKLDRGEGKVWRDIFDGKVRSDILIYGASRAWQHIDPAIVSDSLKRTVYNVGIHAYPFEMQYLRHKLLLRYNKKPKLIIHSLDFMTFQKRADLFDPDQFLPYMLWDTLIASHTSNYKGYTLADHYVPLVRYYGKINAIHMAVGLSLRSAPNPPGRINGYEGVDAGFVDAFAEGGPIKGSYKIIFDAQTVHLFDRYLQECARQGIKVIFVYTPEYITGQRYVSNRAELFALIRKFGTKYSIPLYDYSLDSISYDKTYFYNAEHLNIKGSQLFSRKLAHDLKRDSAIVKMR